MENVALARAGATCTLINTVFLDDCAAAIDGNKGSGWYGRNHDSIQVNLKNEMIIFRIDLSFGPYLMRKVILDFSGGSQKVIFV